MTIPSDVSFKGLVNWAEQSTTPGVHPVGQDINADLVDGKHYADLKSEWENYASSAGGGGVVAMGSANFAGNGNYTTVSFTPALPASYAVYIIPDAATSSYAGEYWVSNKTNSSFRIYNAGSATTSFQWAVAVLGQMPDLAGPASGDISGTHPGPYTVTRMQGRSISSATPSTGQVLTWNGSSWAPAAASATPAASTIAGRWIASWAAEFLILGDMRLIWNSTDGVTVTITNGNWDGAAPHPANIYIGRQDGAAFSVLEVNQTTATFTVINSNNVLMNNGTYYQVVQMFANRNYYMA